MSIKTVLFDLDGTLLPMDQEVFVKAYLGLLAQHMAKHGYEPKKLVEAVWKGSGAMVANDGSQSNEKVFWRTFEKVYGAPGEQDAPLFEEFYKTDFIGARQACGVDPKVPGMIAALKQRGLRVAIATNPLFPRIATENRIRWAGLDPEDFELFTTYETSTYCKPNPNYYRQVTEKLGVRPEECLMVGNDVAEDMIARELGMEVFLVPACLLNKYEQDISGYPRGNFDDLLDFVDGKLGKE